MRASVALSIVAMTSALSCHGLPTESAEPESDQGSGASAAVQSGCALFGAPVSTETQWRYAILWNGETHGLDVVRVERVDGSQIELSTTVRLSEETRIQWSTTVDCGSHRILAQQRSDLALAPRRAASR